MTWIHLDIDPLDNSGCLRWSSKPGLSTEKVEKFKGILNRCISQMEFEAQKEPEEATVLNTMRHMRQKIFLRRADTIIEGSMGGPMDTGRQTETRFAESCMIL
jgi:hypothetical protein